MTTSSTLDHTHLDAPAPAEIPTDLRNRLQTAHQAEGEWAAVYSYAIASIVDAVSARIPLSATQRDAIMQHLITADQVDNDQWALWLSLDGWSLLGAHRSVMATIED